MQSNQEADPLAEWAKFKSENPEVAAKLEDTVKDHVKQAEHMLDGAPGDAKQQQAFTSALAAIYDGADLFFGFAGPIDILVKNVIIPALPGLIDSAVAWFNESGLFGGKHAK